MLARTYWRREATQVTLSINLTKLRLDQLQEAIRSNQVTFPAQVPVFIKHSAGKTQCHVVLLYFVRGWSCDRIAQRYAVTRQHIWQIVSEWRRHAVALGYLQVIPPAEALTPLRAATAAVAPAFPPRLAFAPALASGFTAEEVFQPVRSEVEALALA